MLTEIFDLVQKFTSNRPDWANFGQYFQNATAAAIQLVGAQDADKMPSIQKSMEQMLG